jgi:hypothetical protein
MTCSYPVEEGTCPQPKGPSGYCYYHDKVAAKLLEQTVEYLSETELEQMFGGRRRNDGRRLDKYV